jgi:putative transcriptional regulator
VSGQVTPPDALLLDCAAGAASPAIELLIATHLTMSKESRDLYLMMETVGGALLEAEEGDRLDKISAASALEAIDSLGQARPDHGLEPASVSAAGMVGRTPRSIKDQDLPTPLLDFRATGGESWHWRQLGFGVAAASVTAPPTEERAHLLWARPRTQIARHRHVGREVVLVLSGAFWDDGVRYGPGDVAVSEDGSIHAPTIDEGDDCLCLAVTEAPVEFTGPMGWALNRFCRF